MIKISAISPYAEWPYLKSQASLKCYFCHQNTGVIRKIELETATITKRAHVDCSQGHSQYRAVSDYEIKLSANYHQKN